MKKMAPLILAAGLVGGAGAMALAPTLAGAASSTTVTVAPTAKAGPLKTALDGLVADGTITQAQADKVLSRLQSALPKGPGLAGGRAPLAAALGKASSEVAGYLGLTPAQLRTELQGGKSLAQIGGDQGKTTDGLITTIVNSGKKALDAAVSNGRLTQAQADNLASKLEDQAKALVDQAHPAAGLRGRLGRRGQGTTTTTAPAS
jgi:polyhydroxyalkanoate synthesis regulator phasin